MKLYVLFEQMPEAYEGQYAPVAHAVIDEYTVANLGMGLESALKREVNHLKEARELSSTAQYAWIEVDLGATELKIRDAILQPMVTIAGNISTPAPAHGGKNPSITVTQGRRSGRVIDDEIVE